MSKAKQNPWVVLRVRFNVAWSEWVVHHSDGEAKNYHTDDKDDAIATRDAIRDHEIGNGMDVEYVGHCPGGIEFFNARSDR